MSPATAPAAAASGPDHSRIVATVSKRHRKPSQRVTCPGCRQRFAPSRDDQRYCSGRCRQRGQRARGKADDLDREIEQTRLRYWQLVYLKARALGRGPADVLTGSESQYVDREGNVWKGGVFGDGKDWRCVGKKTPHRPGWAAWGLEAAGPSWAPPGPKNGFYERAILGKGAQP